MNEEELKQTLDLLSEAGIKVMVCDTQVACSSVSVKCGSPTVTGDSEGEGYVMLPKVLVGAHPEIFVPVVTSMWTE